MLRLDDLWMDGRLAVSTSAGTSLLTEVDVTNYDDTTIQCTDNPPTFLWTLYTILNIQRTSPIDPSIFFWNRTFSPSWSPYSGPVQSIRIFFWNRTFSPSWSSYRGPVQSIRIYSSKTEHSRHVGHCHNLQWHSIAGMRTLILPMTSPCRVRMSLVCKYRFDRQRVWCAVQRFVRASCRFNQLASKTLNTQEDTGL